VHCAPTAGIGADAPIYPYALRQAQGEQTLTPLTLISPARGEMILGEATSPLRFGTQSFVPLHRLERVLQPTQEAWIPASAGMTH